MPKWKDLRLILFGVWTVALCAAMLPFVFVPAVSFEIARRFHDFGDKCRDRANELQRQLNEVERRLAKADSAAAKRKELIGAEQAVSENWGRSD